MSNRWWSRVRLLACGDRNAWIDQQEASTAICCLPVWQRFVGEEVDAEFQIWTVEAGREWRELALSCDGAPTGFVDGLVLAAAVEVHGRDATVRENGEADEGFALFVEGWTCLFGDEGIPVAFNILKDAPNIWAEVDTLHVG